MKNTNLNGKKFRKFITVISLLAAMTISACGGDVFQRLTGGKVLRVDVTPLNDTIIAGTSLQYKAVAIFSNNTKADVTDIAEWNTSDKAVATISELGVAKSLTPGSITVSATHKGVTGETQLTVSNAVLVSLSVTPTNPIVGKGTTQQFTATGIFSDSTTQDLTSSATWSSANTSIATVNSSGLASAAGKGSATITASFGGFSGSTLLGVTDATLVSIQITPDNSSKAKGTIQQFTATGLYTDNSTQDLTTSVTWSSSDNSITSISNAAGSRGVATAADLGTVTVTATLGTISDTTGFTVTAATLSSISVTPVNSSAAKGTTQQFSATGIYSDSTTQDLTSTVVWSSSSNSVASISNASGSEGLASAADTGTVTITAASGSISGTTNFTVTAATLVSIGITPANSSKAKGTTQQFTATGTYTDSTTQDITTSVTWFSSGTSIATISNAAGSRGLGTAVSTGSVTITATLGSISGTTGFTVTPATLSSISITPTNPVRAKGTTQQFTATGIYTDSTTQDITSAVTWSSTNSAVATISNASGTNGIATAADTGSVTITATSGTISGTTNFTVTAATLVSIAVTPTDPIRAKGTTQQFIATGTYTDNSTQNLTTSVTWSSSNDSIASISNSSGTQGIATAADLGAVTITATLGTISGTTNFTVTAATLSSITVTPVNSSAAKGTTQQFTATGIYSDNSTQDLTSTVTWSSSSASVASISNATGSIGLATAIDPGTITITAASGSISGTTNFAVTAAALVSIGVTPVNSSAAKGTTQQFTATGTYTDSTTHDLTSTVTWSSTNSSTASISNAAGSRGLATAVNNGSVTITATLGTVSGNTGFTVTNATLSSINITPTNPVRAKGTTQQFTATGTYTDSTTQDLTASVTWSSTNSAVATISNASGTNGLATAVDTGSVTITAISGTVSSTTSFTVTAATLVSITVTPTDPSIAKGTTQQFTATGLYTDGTNQNLTTTVTWSSSSTSTATISNVGLASAVNTGSTTITASMSGLSGTSTLTVTPATLVSINLVPANVSRAKGTTEQFTATGVYTDGSNQDLTSTATWASSTPAIASISNATGSKGLATAVSIGTVTITAASGGVTGTTNFSVTNAALVSINVNPVNPTKAKGTTEQFSATGVYTDGSTLDLTTSVTWSSSDNAVASISSASGSEGLATTITTGTTTITATSGTISGSTLLTVTAAALVSINITPAEPTNAKGTTRQFTATGTYTDTTTQDITTLVTWSSSNTSIATINASTGLGTATGTGTATISAVLDGVTGTTSFHVTAATLVSIGVTPAGQTNARGTSLQFTATGTYTDGSTQNLTSSVTWTSSSNTIATVSNTGLGYAANLGSVTITATSGSISGNTGFTVTGAVLVSIEVTPTNPTKAKGTTQQFTATGIYSDSTTQNLTSTVTWDSSDTLISTINSSGLATAVDVGSSTITATSGSINGSTTFTVTDATLVSISVSPPNSSKAQGTTQQFTATGIYTDGTTQNLTTQVVWTSQNSSIANISNAAGSQGLCMAVQNGSVTITATLGAVSGNTNFTVTDEELVSIAVTPTNPTKAKGTTQQFTAIGTYTDNSTQDITTSVTWSSTDVNIATVSNADGSKGLGTAVNIGSVTISASLGTAIPGTTSFTVTEETLVSISVSPTNQSKAKGTTLQFTATGYYTDGSNQDITTQVTWSSTDSNIAAVSNASGSQGLATAVNLGTATISATSGGTISGSTSFHVTDATLVSISVTPINSSKAKGTTQQFVATGTYTDNSTQILTTVSAWSSSNEGVATISNGTGSEGLGTARETGLSVITATYQGISGSTNFTVTAATVASITVTPTTPSKAKGTTQQFTATAIYTDTTTQDITTQVAWSSNDESISTISNASGSQGLATAVNVGTATITASLGITASGSTTFTVTTATLVSIGITPSNTSIAKGTTQQLTATGIYTDNSTQDLTSLVTWWSTSDSTATVSNVDGSRGLSTAVTTGTVTITATLGTVSGTTNLTVTAATLSSITITPANLSLTVNRTQQYTATGTYTDGTTQNLTTSVTWSSSATAYADISNADGSKGIATTIAATGSTTITATYGVIYGTTQLTVTNASLLSIMVSPVNRSLAAGLNLQFQATGIYNDDSTQDITSQVTWTSSNTGRATISNAAGSQGLATGVGAGSTTITATLGAATPGTTTLTVTAATLVAVTVTPVNQTLIANGTTLQFTATGIFSDSTTQNITSQVTWTSSNTSYATISNASGSKGYATSVNAGTTTITATHSGTGLSGNTLLTVSNATLQSITITPDNPICYGTTQQFRATGNFSDSTTQDITTLVTWSSSHTSYATISNASGTNGLAVARGVGATIITATFGTISNTTILYVRAAVLNAILISPVDPSLVLPNTMQFTATGEYGDAVNGYFYQDLTSQVLWESDNETAAVISNASGSQGFVSSVAAGTSHITASRDGISGMSTLNVTADTTAPVITAVTLLDSARIKVTYSEPVNVTQAGAASNYKITSSVSGNCTDNSNYGDSGQTSDISITSVTVLSSTDYILNITSSMQAINYTLLADKTQIRDLASTPNYLGCPNNMDFTGVDTTSPTVLSASSLNPTTLRVTFSENVNASVAQNKTSYKIVNTSAVAGTCTDNSNFTSSTQTSDFSISSVAGSGRVYDLTLSATQISGRAYTVIVNTSVLYDLAATPNALGCPNYAEFTGLEQLKVVSAQSATLYSFIVTFSKNVKTGINIAGSAAADNEAQAENRYKVSSELGDITSAAILDGTVCNGAAADASKVCITHTLAQGGSQYTVIVANATNGDGFDDAAWGSIRNSGDTENVQLSPKDRATFVGCGTIPQNLSDGAIVTNPFADNSAFGYLSSYFGKIYIGPNTNGNGANRFNPDGSTPEQITFTFNKDTSSTGGTTTSTNSATTRDGSITVPPFVTIGHTGCTSNSANIATGCGPNNENGRGLFTSGIINGNEYMFISGGRSAGSNYYLYWTTSTSTTLGFNFIDLYNAFYNTPGGGHVGGNSGTESIIIFNNRIYWMSPGNRSYRPYLMKVLDTTAQSMNTTNSKFLMMTWMPGFGYSANTNPNKADMVGGTMFVFNDRLYIANSGSITDSGSCNIGTTYSAGVCEQTGGLIRSNNNNPGYCGSSSTCTDWSDITPSSVKFHQYFSNVLTKMADLIPADRPIPGFATFNSNLYMIRNACTTSRWNRSCMGDTCTDDQTCPSGSEVPQLWKCTPGTTGASTTCEAGDWSLVAENVSTGKTNMGSTSNSKITLIAANGSQLYIGYDNSNGAQVWRTKSGITNPTSESDFEQVGTSGLNGTAANTQLFSAVSLQQGSVYYLYISAGNSGIPVKVFRQQNQ